MRVNDDIDDEKEEVEEEEKEKEGLDPEDLMDDSDDEDPLNSDNEDARFLIINPDREDDLGDEDAELSEIKSEPAPIAVNVCDRRRIGIAVVAIAEESTCGANVLLALRYDPHPSCEGVLTRKNGECANEYTDGTGDDDETAWSDVEKRRGDEPTDDGDSVVGSQSCGQEQTIAEN
ncbi:hypothetical protein BGZ54_005916 [Gamsiella multidivaricata]|nr:hypothetical protein BGZ54_005916 [Gamsiella multidivaricata]